MDAFQLLATKAALLKCAVDPQVPPGPAAKMPFIDMDTTSEWARSDTTPHPKEPLPPKTPVPSVPGRSSFATLMKNHRGKVGLGLAGIGATGTYLYNRATADPVPSADPVSQAVPLATKLPPTLAPLIPALRRRPFQGNISRESLRKTMHNASRNALGTFWNKMVAKYGRPPVEPPL